MNTADIQNIIPELNTELHRILNFWMQKTQDEEQGGFVGEIDGSNNISPNAEKGAVLNARILWTFSAAYNFNGETQWLKMADRAYQYLINHFWDKENGGLFWSLQPNGEVKNSRKQAYAQGFGIYAFSEYYRATKKPESLHYAQQLYTLLEEHFKDPIHSGYIEALSADWVALEDMRLSEKDANLPKSMNTHLHIIEPYTNLYRVWPDANLRKSIQDLIVLFSDKIVNQKTAHFQLFFELDWTVKSEIVSYGHDIEGAWLLNEAAHFIGDKSLQHQMKDLSMRMVDATLAEGLDTDGSLFYESENNHLDSDKHWWPQAEALVGLLDAYENTKDKKYMESALNSWNFISTKIVDKANGEWFWKVDKNGKPDLKSPKTGFWKCPYHNTRALIEAITRIQKLG